MNQTYTRRGAMLLTASSVLASRVVAQEAQPAMDDWAVWRGPTLLNRVPPERSEAIPTTWSPQKNVLWRSPVPGRGHATPIVVNGQVFVFTHNPAKRSLELLRYRLRDGQAGESTLVHSGVTPPPYLHSKNTCASSTPSSDGRAVFTVAQVNDSIIASAVELDGKIRWQQFLSPYRAGGGWFGYGASPLLVDNRLIIAIDVDNEDSTLLALDVASGRRLWKTSRPRTTSYSSPILATVGGVKQIVISGGNKVASYDPTTGREGWSVDATSRTTCGTMVWNDTMAFASGSYPDPGTYGIRVEDGRARIVWENKVKCYEQSMLVVGDHLYGIADNGVAYCWRCDDGAEQWKSRLTGPFSASPLLVGDNIFASNEAGTTYVFAADPIRYRAIAENQLGTSSFASPIVAGGKLILRHADGDGDQRQEFLAAIG